MKLKNKTAIITGASRGIGKEVAIQLAKKGVNTVLVARGKEDLKKLRNTITKLGAETLIVPADISEEQEVEKVMKKAIKRFGKVDIIINNAGIGVFKPVEEIETKEWDDVMQVNVRGTFLLTKAVIPAMKKRKQSWIINIASDVSKRTFANGSVYCASKYAQHAFAESVRKEVSSFGIKVSNIYPGLVDTYFGDTQQGIDEKKDWLKPKDIAKAVLYILDAPNYTVIDEIMLHPTVQEW
ncbi:MAG: NADP-dependent 3-hydroxy acid dehydrogenase YdfG [Flammeovirgaceae bacterium]|jgi:NADP-dependent 3-hydroxy acid dehydrogenase YdfG